MKVFAEVLGKQRLYILLLLFFFCLNLKLFTEETGIEKQEEGMLKEAEPENIAFELELIKKYTNENKAGKYFTGAASKEAVLFLDGFWETALKGGGGVEISNGTAAAATVPIVFEQKANLTLFLLVKQHYYFETIYREQLNKSVLAIGYIGGDENAVKHIRAGNSGIKFPLTYSFIKTGGSSQIAPGIMGCFAGEKWQADFAVRYESGEMNSKTYYGTNEAIKHKLSLSSWERAKYFYLPVSELYGKQLEIYVKDSDSGGWRLLGGHEYNINRHEKILTLKKSFPHGVAVNCFDSFTQDFINSVKKLFTNIPLKIFQDFVLKGGISKVKIKGKDFLMLKNEKSFSPFEVASRYSASICGRNDGITVNKKITEDVCRQFTASFSENFFDTEDFSSNSFIQVLYSNNHEGISPLFLFPFIFENPSIYLPYEKYTENFEENEEKSSLEIVCTKYLASEGFFIPEGTDPASIEVYKNGIPFTAFSYDEQTGTVTLNEDVLNSDKIEIKWRDNKLYSNTGLVRSAIGVHVKPIPELDLFFSSAADNSVTKDPVPEKPLYDKYFLAAGLNFTKEAFKTGCHLGFESSVPKNDYRIQNYNRFDSRLYADYNKEGSILEQNGTPIFSNPKIYAELKAAQYIKKETPKINSSLEAAIDIWRISLSGKMTLQDSFNADKKIIETAGHTIKFPLFFFYADESFFINRSMNYLSRENNFRLNKYVFLNHCTSLNYGKFFCGQKMTISIQPLIPQTHFGHFFTECRVLLNQKYALPETHLTNNYTGAWAESLQKSYSGGENNAFFREEKVQLIFNWFNASNAKEKKASINGFNFETSADSSYRKGFQNIKTENIFYSFSLSTEINGIFLTPMWERKNIRVVNGSFCSNYQTDLESLFSGIQEQKWVYSSIFLYDLFSRNIVKDMSLKQTDGHFFSTSYALNMSRLISTSITDLYTPLEFNTRLTRIVKSVNSKDEPENIYGLDFLIAYTVLNISGNYGFFNWFSGYEQDELERRYKWSFYFAKEYFRFNFDSTHKLAFYFSKKNKFTIENQFTINTLKQKQKKKIEPESWSERVSLIYIFTGGGSLTSLIISSFSNAVLSDEREEKFSFAVLKNQQESPLSFKADFTHTQKTKIGGYGEIKCFASIAALHGDNRFYADFLIGIACKVEY